MSLLLSSINEVRIIFVKEFREASFYNLTLGIGRKLTDISNTNNLGSDDNLIFNSHTISLLLFDIRLLFTIIIIH